MLRGCPHGIVYSVVMTVSTNSSNAVAIFDDLA
jgi:hypothetical protein